MEKVSRYVFHFSKAYILLYVCTWTIVGCSGSALYMNEESEEDKELLREDKAAIKIQAFVRDYMARQSKAIHITPEEAAAKLAEGRRALVDKIGAETAKSAKESMKRFFKEDPTIKKRQAQMKEALKGMFPSPKPKMPWEQGVMFHNADPNQYMELVYRGDVKSYNGSTGEVMFRDGTSAHYRVGVWFYNLAPGMHVDDFDALDMLRKGVASYDHTTQKIVFEDGTSGHFPEALAEADEK